MQARRAPKPDGSPESSDVGPLCPCSLSDRVLYSRNEARAQEHPAFYATGEGGEAKRRLARHSGQGRVVSCPKPAGGATTAFSSSPMEANEVYGQRNNIGWASPTADLFLISTQAWTILPVPATNIYEQRGLDLRPFIPCPADSRSRGQAPHRRPTAHPNRSIRAARCAARNGTNAWPAWPQEL